MVFLPLIVDGLFVDCENGFNESENEGDGIEKWLADTTVQGEVEETDQQPTILEANLTLIYTLYQLR